jgi:hypothetical protein
LLSRRLWGWVNDEQQKRKETCNLKAGDFVHDSTFRKNGITTVRANATNVSLWSNARFDPTEYGISIRAVKRTVVLIASLCEMINALVVFVETKRWISMQLNIEALDKRKKCARPKSVPGEKLNEVELTLVGRQYCFGPIRGPAERRKEKGKSTNNTQEMCGFGRYFFWLFVLVEMPTRNYRHHPNYVPRIRFAHCCDFTSLSGLHRCASEK